MTDYSDKEYGVDPDVSTLRELLDESKRFENGDSFTMEETGEHVIVCCDCGLAHKITVERLDNGLIKIATWRHPNLTRAFRQDADYHFPLNPRTTLVDEVDDREDNITVGEDDQHDREA